MCKLKPNGKNKKNSSEKKNSHSKTIKKRNRGMNPKQSKNKKGEVISFFLRLHCSLSLPPFGGLAIHSTQF
jgi:hypothetical protein